MHAFDLRGLLSSIAEGDLDSVPVLCDLLEELDDPRAAQVRALYVALREDRTFAPFSFRHFNVTRRVVLPLFPEYEEPEG